MPQLFNQSPESKAIKRINEQLSEVNKLIEKEYRGEGRNPLIANWSRAIRESGVAFTVDPRDKDAKTPGRYRIKNTKENQQKVSKLEKLLKEYKSQTAGEYRKKIKEELKKEAAELAKRQHPIEKDINKKTQREIEKARRAFEKEYTSREKQRERLKEHLMSYEIQEMLDYIYKYEGDKSAGEMLSKLTKGKKYSERGSEIYNEFGRIRRKYLDLLYNGVQEEREKTNVSLEEMLESMSDIGEAFPEGEEVQINGGLDRDRKRRHR